MSIMSPSDHILDLFLRKTKQYGWGFLMCRFLVENSVEHIDLHI